MQTVLSESQVVLATCHSSGGRQVRSQNFDVVIIDEATQAVEAVSVCPCELRYLTKLHVYATGLLDSDLQGTEIDPRRGPDATTSDYHLHRQEQEGKIKRESILR